MGASSDRPLCEMIVRDLNESMDDAKDLLRVDFANEVIGGVLSSGNVQEEIMFAECPECNCARLVFTKMRDNEAIVLHGGEQFAEHMGYGNSLTCKGGFDDPSPIRQGILSSFVTAIDAIDYSLMAADDQRP